MKEYWGRLLFVAGVAAAASLAAGPRGALGAQDAPAGTHPSVVLIVSDDLGYHDLGFQGSPDIPTPNLDALANSGTRFTDAYVTGPLCGPSRAGLMSGRYQQKHSYDFMPRPNQGLATTEATIADAFHAAGYATEAVGKWNLGELPQYRPQQRGFDDFLGFLGAMHPYVPGPVAPELRMVGEAPRPGWNGEGWGGGGGPGGARGWPPSTQAGLGTGPDGRAARGPTTRQARGGRGGGPGGGPGGETPGAGAGHLVRGGREVEEPGYLTDAFGDEAVQFVNRHAAANAGGDAKPFFLYLAFNASHSPLQPLPKYLARFPNLSGKRQLYAATTSAMDDQVGRVVDAVRKIGRERDTLFVYVNDNGGPIRDIAADNTPLGGAKGSLWEGGIRVPFFARWAGHLPAGRVEHQPAISLDIFPTLLAAAGVPVPPGKHFEGANLYPLLTDQPGAAAPLADRTLYWRFGPQWAIRQGHWKLVVPETGITDPLLFDLATDVGETRNVAHAHPDIVKRLTASWQQWDATNLPLPANYRRGGAQARGKPVPPADAVLFRDDDT